MDLDKAFVQIIAHRRNEDNQLELLVKLPLTSGPPRWLSAETVRSRGVHESQLVDKFLAQPENQVTKMFGG